MEDRELIEKYFDRSLSDGEKELFRAKYENDTDFRNQTDLQARLLAALAVNEADSRGSVKRGRTFLKRRSVMVAAIACAAVLVLGIVIPAVLDNDRGGVSPGQSISSSVTDSVKITGPDSTATETDRNTAGGADRRLTPDRDSRRVAVVPETPAADPNIHSPRTDAAPARASGGSDSIAPKEVRPQSGGEVKSLTMMFVDGAYWVLWRPLEGRASVFIYALSADGTKTEVASFTRHDYDLAKGEFALEGIDTTGRYEFVIRRRGAADVTLAVSF